MNDARRMQRSMALYVVALGLILGLGALSLPATATDGCDLTELAPLHAPLSQPDDGGCCPDGASPSSHALSNCAACGGAAALSSFDLPTVSVTDLVLRAPALHPMHAPTSLDRPPDSFNLS